MRRPSRIAFMLCAALLLCVSACVRLTAPETSQAEPPLRHEDWMTIRMGAVPVGYAHTVTRRIEEPEPSYVTTVFVQMTVRRFKMDLATIRETTEHREDLNGRIISATSHQEQSQNEIVREAVVSGDKLLVKTSTAGRVKESEMPWDNCVLGPYAQAVRLQQSAAADGTTIEYKDFMPSLLRIVNTTVTVGPMDEIEYGGRKVMARRCAIAQDILKNMPSTAWFDEEWNCLRQWSPMLGGTEMRRATREEALRAIVPQEASDLLANLSIPSNTVIQKPRDTKVILYRITGKEGALRALQLEDRRQTVETREGDTLVLRVRALGDAAKPADRQPAAEYLAPAMMLQSDDPEVMRLAREAVVEASTPAEKTKRMESWVYHNMKHRDFTVVYASAKEVAVSREGDCSEHAMLLAAMLRAQGIPSRLVIGLLYQDGAFWWHMWTEAFLNDWTALDATLDAPVADATHIKLWATSLADDQNPFLGLAAVPGQITLTVEDVQYSE